MSAQNPPHEQPQEDEVESDQNHSLSNLDKDEKHRVIGLSGLQCAVCRGIIQNTRTLMECFHKFCKECIEKSIRLGVNECPVCHVHVSQLSLKEDPQYDAIVSAIVPQIVKYKTQEEVDLLLLGKTNDKETMTNVRDNRARNSRLSKFIDLLRNSDVKIDQLEIHLELVSLDEQRAPSLQEPYVVCRPSCTVKTVCKYIERNAKMLRNQVELFLIEESEANAVSGKITVDADKDKLRVLRDEETLAELYTPNVTHSARLLLGYKMK